MADHSNPECPDYSSHWLNACELLFPGVDVLSVEQDELAVAHAEREYRACEGH
jgi:hypothetical protein